MVNYKVPHERIRAVAGKPNGLYEMKMWYHISNYGVTNKPSN